MTQSVETERRPVMPPMLYVPVRNPAVRKEMVIDFLRLSDGRIALAAYTALDRLVRGCGERQPWAMIPTSALGEIDKYQPYDVVLLDVDLRGEPAGSEEEG